MNWVAGAEFSIMRRDVGCGEVIGEGVGEADEEAGEFGAVMVGPAGGRAVG